MIMSTCILACINFKEVDPVVRVRFSPIYLMEDAILYEIREINIPVEIFMVFIGLAL